MSISVNLIVGVCFDCGFLIKGMGMGMIESVWLKGFGFKLRNETH